MSETERLIRLVNDLLLLARADSKQPLRREPVQTQALLEDLCRQARLLAPQRTIVCRPVPDLYIAADPDALKQVLLVLLDNALKHTRAEAATITIAAAEENERITIRVHDNGPGIEPRYQSRVFGLFDRLDNSVPGTGIGLALVRRIVELHDGSIWIESRGDGQGSCFCFTLPLQRGN